MPRLYVSPGSYSLGAHVALIASGVAHEIVRARFAHPDNPALAVNPLGRVPTLVLDDGSVFTENGAILPLIASLNPSARLGGESGSGEAARIREWIGFLNSDVQAALAEAQWFPPSLSAASGRSGGRLRRAGTLGGVDIVRPDDHRPSSLFF